MLLSDLGGPPRPLLLFLLALLFLVDPLRLLLLANIDQHLAHGRTDLTLYAFAPQLALVGQVVEVGEALGLGQHECRHGKTLHNPIDEEASRL